MRALFAGETFVSCGDPVGALASHSYRYDARGNPIEETWSAGPARETVQYGYDAADRLIHVGFGPGETISYSLGADGSRLAETRVAGGMGRSLTYGYDALGGLSRIEDGLGAIVAEYTTDAAERLRSERRGPYTRKPQLGGGEASFGHRDR